MRALLVALLLVVGISAQTPPSEVLAPGVSLELAKWRAAHYSDVRYKLNLTLEKMSPVLKGTIEIRVKVSEPEAAATGSPPPIILDWRKIIGHEDRSTISNVSLNGIALSVSPLLTRGLSQPAAQVEDKYAKARASARAISDRSFEEYNEHLIFREGVVAGENVIKLDFTSPILTSGSAITRYVDKEDGSEYIYSLFVPSDASTAFPVFDQPDLKARFTLEFIGPTGWTVIANSGAAKIPDFDSCILPADGVFISPLELKTLVSSGKPYNMPFLRRIRFEETQPISTYVFAFAAGPFERVSEPGAIATGFRRSDSRDAEAGPEISKSSADGVAKNPVATAPGSDIYVRKSQAAKFQPHAAEVFRLNREAIKYFEEYFDYKFPFPKYDLVLIPEFPFGGMEHAGATFLRESSIIFPQEPTRNDHISRALLIFHEASHQWFGDTVTMRWFDDLWLKEGFATFTAYKAMERIMPEMNAWKVFYERVKQAAYQTDSTKGTTPIYQEIPNLSAAKSAYGNIVYNKAPAFLRQAEFYLGEDKFQTAVRAFLKKHEFGNAGWEDLVKEFADSSQIRSRDMQDWAEDWVKQKGVPRILLGGMPDRSGKSLGIVFFQNNADGSFWTERFKVQLKYSDGSKKVVDQIVELGSGETKFSALADARQPVLVFPNYGDYGYGIFLLDDKSRDYVLKNIQNEKDPFLRSMMWGALWDSVREGELDPREYVELVVRVLMQKPAREQGRDTQRPDIALANARASAIEDESTTALLLSRVGTAMSYYVSEPLPKPAREQGRNTQRPDTALANARASATDDLRSRVEEMLIDRMQNAETLGQRLTFYRAFLTVAASERARGVLKAMLSEPPAVAGGLTRSTTNVTGTKTASVKAKPTNTDLQPPATAGGSDINLRTKDKFDIVTRLLILGDADGPKLLAELEKTETSDDAKRYAYAARAGIPTAENKAKYWNDFVNNKDISESWIEAAFGPWNSIRHSELTLPYLERALKELPNHKRNRKIFFVNGWLGAFIGGQRSEEALGIINKFLADNPTLDNDLKLKILENADIIERGVNIRSKYANSRP